MQAHIFLEQEAEAGSGHPAGHAAAAQAGLPKGERPAPSLVVRRVSGRAPHVGDQP